MKPEHRFCPSCGAPQAVAAPPYDADAEPSGPTVTVDPAGQPSPEQWHVVEQSPPAPPSWEQPEPADYGAAADGPAYEVPVYGAPGYDQHQQYPDGTQQQPAYDPGMQGGYDPAYGQPSYGAPAYGQHYGAPAYDPYNPYNAPTTAQPVVYDPNYQYGQLYAQEELRRVTPLGVVVVLMGIAAVLSAAVTVVSGTTNFGQGAPSSTLSLKLKDFFTNNLPVVVVIAAVAVLAAALGAGTKRLGTGLAGGIGLAAAGWSSMIVGNSVAILDVSERAAIGTGALRFTRTFDIGFFALCAVVVLGILAFVLSLPGSGSDGMPKLHPLATVVGALGTLAMAGGPLIPGNGLSFDVNFKSDFFPVLTIVARLVMLALLAFAGLAGFLNARRWGLGVAAGGLVVGVTMWLTALISGKGKRVAGIGGANFGRDAADPHIVTTLGVVAVLAAFVIAVVFAQMAMRTRDGIDPGLGG